MIFYFVQLMSSHFEREYVWVFCIFYLQIHEEARKFSYQTGVRVVVAYGGAPINQQVVDVLFLYFSREALIVTYHFSSLILFFISCKFCLLKMIIKQLTFISISYWI